MRGFFAFVLFGLVVLTFGVSLFILTSGVSSVHAQTLETPAVQNVNTESRPENGWSFQERAADLKRKAELCKSNEWVNRALTSDQKKQAGAVVSCEEVCNSQGQIVTQYAQTKLSATDASEAVKRVVNACEETFYAFMSYVERATPTSKNYYELLPVNGSAEDAEVADQHYNRCLKRGFPDQICKCSTNLIIEGINKGMGKTAWRLGDIPLKRGVCTQN